MMSKFLLKDLIGAMKVCTRDRQLFAVFGESQFVEIEKFD